MNFENNLNRTPFAPVLAGVMFIGAYGLVIENPFLLTLGGYTCALALFALSVNLMLGGVGEVPLGQSLFFGLGAYGVGIGMKKLGLSYEGGLLVGAVVAAALSLAIGNLTLRLTGAYFSIVSWGLASVAVVVALNMEHITGGGMGLFALPPMYLTGLDLSQPVLYFYVAAAMLTGAVVLLVAVRDSRFGCALECVRQNRHLASALGIDVFRQRLKAFVLSAVLAAVAGALSVPYTQIVTHESLGIGITVDALLMVLLGGVRWLYGPILGAVVFSVVPFYLELDVNVRMFVFSIAIILIMMLVPNGLHQCAQALVSRLKGVRDVRI
jgi:branched-chain amino acid transport system permease protein